MMEVLSQNGDARPQDDSDPQHHPDVSQGYEAPLLDATSRRLPNAPFRLLFNILTRVETDISSIRKWKDDRVRKDDFQWHRLSSGHLEVRVPFPLELVAWYGCPFSVSVVWYVGPSHSLYGGVDMFTTPVTTDPQRPPPLEDQPRAARIRMSGHALVYPYFPYRILLLVLLDIHSQGHLPHN
ncbi:hypothetical protein L6452_34705 [Arctium lappa]|uniref:Uncharacterized protein n=1 Tax=Arctium lappa TaxID=4217 RepID=A0ACB8YJ22_ARCLA|nr:hypothetical protein L6452_34705 [Arctium lappa]